MQQQMFLRYSALDDCCRRRCHPHEKCSDGQEGCETSDDCQTGLECLSSGICKEIDECSTAVGTGLTYCGPNTDCTNTVGSFSCACSTGYQTHYAYAGCSDIDECKSNTHLCLTNTDCTNTDGGHNCTCKSGYEGDPLVGCIDIDECALGGKYACTTGDKTGTQIH
jgi:hypothetical protein